jgi:tetratricopeptide (TPR) repeat protein
MRKKNSSAQASDAVSVSANSAARAVTDQPSRSPIELTSWVRRYAVWLPVALALLASLVTLANDFACDDIQQIVNNGLIKSLTNLTTVFTSSAWQFAPADIGSISQAYYRPLFNVWLMLNSALFGSSAWGWHLLLALLHAAATAMVFVVIKQLFDKREMALIAACLFAVLPVHAEAVAWVSGGVEVLMTLLLLAALHFYLRFRQSGQLYEIALALVFYLLALWTKEAALVFPFLVVYLELAHPKRTSKSRGASAAMMAAGLLMMTAIYTLMRYQANDSVFAADETRLPLGAALLTIPLAIVKYLALLVWPFDYSYLHYTLPVASVGSVGLLAPLAALIALVFVVARYGSQDLRFAGAWLLLTLAPALLVMNRFELEHLIQERYLYLPSLGFCLALALGVEWLAARQSFKLSPGRFAFAAAATVVALCSLAYIWHSRHWRDSLSVYRQAVAVAPDSPPALSALATELAMAGRARDAEPSARRAIELDPQYINGYFRLSYLSAQQGNVSKALDILEQARSTVTPTEINRKEMATLLLNLSRIYSQKKDHATAIEDAQQSQMMWPRTAGIYYTGLAYFNAGHNEEALTYYQEVLRRVPAGYAAIHLSLGVLYDNLGRLEDARDEYQKYLALSPKAGDSKNVQSLLKNVTQKIMLNGGSSGGTK